MSITFRPCGGPEPDPCEGLAPTITDMPEFATADIPFTITGTNLEAVIGVKVAETYVPFVLVSATAVQVTVPSTLPGLPLTDAPLVVNNSCGSASSTIDVLILGLDLPAPSGDIVDIDAQWDAVIHNPLAQDLTGLTIRLTASQPPGQVLLSDLVVSMTGSSMTGTQDGDAGVWTSGPFGIASGGDFALYVTITHDDDSTLAGTVDLLGELLSAGGAVLASSTGTLTIEV